MIRRISIFFAIAFCTTLPQLALSHTGHVQMESGHSHWVGFAILFAAGCLAVWQIFGKKRSQLRSDDDFSIAKREHGKAPSRRSSCPNKSA